MTWVILLFVLGISLLAIEVIIPGGIIGVIGCLLMFAGCVVSFLDFGSFWGGVAIATALLLMVLTFFVEFYILPKTRLGKRAFLKAEISATSAAIDKEALSHIGKSATAVTMLSPSGYILVEGKRYEAFCQDGQASAGAALTITGGDNFRLVVSLTKGEP